MTSMIPYLTFNGNCREAMEFYKQCMGGELYLQTVGDSPVSAGMPLDMKQHIMHSSLTIPGGMVLMASDMMGHEGYIKGTNVSILQNCSSELELHDLYKKLAAGGNATYPPKIEFWGALLGSLEDKFGIRWLLNYEKADEGAN